MPSQPPGKARRSDYYRGDHFRGGRLMADHRGHAIYRHAVGKRGTTSARQVLGCSFLTLSGMARSAPRSAVHQWKLLFDLLNFEEASFIVCKHPPCVSRPRVRPAAPSDSRVRPAARAQAVATRVRRVREQCGTMLPKQPTRLGSLVKLGREAAPALRGGDRDALLACGGRFACSVHACG